MHFISEELEDYITAHSSHEPELLKQLDRETHQKILQPRMLSGHYQGRFLSLISKLARPKYILEIGTYTGYSALCLAEGLHPDGKLHTIDINEELYDFQRKYFDLSPYGAQIIQHLGDATTIIPEMADGFDLVFMDADKDNYIHYFHLIVDKMAPGGLLLSDNVLWSGKVLDQIHKDDEATETLVAYNRLVKEDPRLETVLLPIRDGLTVSRKI